jgi:hypothetical protein
MYANTSFWFRGHYVLFIGNMYHVMSLDRGFPEWSDALVAIDEAIAGQDN